ncbi:putative proliferating cell nuclear antigen, PCNA [Rosa chinensis]|uniref:Putative proliferating cell nuclear antigen, PCNA n=1 Tax=Rosa chinensis TaxID=74649 RepID=A0A2P6SGW8_ROSCH|nr:putative proliferating cell nuclear antigen, PCNA [Rosa chinensis]
MFELQLNQGAVLLRKAVAPLVDLADFADVEISPEEVILLTAGNPAISEEDFVVLRIPESTFARFVCDFAGSFVLNLRRLYSNLNRAGDDDALTIHGDDGDDLIGFVTVNSGTGEFGFSEMELSESYAEGLDLPELDYEYRAIIGIPSEEFRHLIIHLHYFGNSGTYHLHYIRFLCCDGHLQIGFQKMSFCFVSFEENVFIFIVLLYHLWYLRVARGNIWSRDGVQWHNNL